jgi:two-component system chemotaxis response regulator CheB
MIKVLIVDDSPSETLMLKAVLECDATIKVIGYARDGAEAVKLVATLKPDLITMDIEMPVMDGFEATRLIMSQCPTPIVVISAKLNDALLNATFKALEAGALTVLDKPQNITSSEFTKTRKYMLDIIRKMSEVKVIKRRTSFMRPTQVMPPVTDPKPHTEHYTIVAIGASVGGPQALKHIFTALPTNFPLPIVVVQHMTAGFIQGFVKWLTGEIKIPVKLAEHQEILQAGKVYFAPDNCHLHVAQQNNQLIAMLDGQEPVAGFCPSITELLHSVTKHCGKQGIGILLTGMGSDGAHGMLALKKTGGHTIIQDPDSAVVFGMAAVAQSLNAVDEVVELGNIADYLIKITKPTLS